MTKSERSEITQKFNQVDGNVEVAIEQPSEDAIQKRIDVEYKGPADFFKRLSNNDGTEYRRKIWRRPKIDLRAL